jgi:hypothetical protein
MNLARHITVLWRFRAVVLAGLLLGIVLAVLAAYQVPSMERRGAETWSAESDVEVTQRGFPEGRVTLPNPLDDTSGSSTSGTQSDIQAFGDPGRFVQLALYYAQVAVSDQVREQLPEKPAPGQIMARNVDATGNGQGWLPIIRLTTTAGTPDGAVQLNQDTIAALTDYLRKNQRDSNTPDDERVQLRVLNQPAPALVSGRSLTISFLAFMLCVLAAIAVAHILENLRPRSPEVLDVEPELEFEPPAVVGAANGSNGRRTAWNGQAHEAPSSGRQVG